MNCWRPITWPCLVLNIVGVLLIEAEEATLKAVLRVVGMHEEHPVPHQTLTLGHLNTRAYAPSGL